MELFPAIDLRDGQVVRLTQGDYDRMEVYARNPAKTAADFLEKGARNLHVVDLDGARDGTVVNFEAIRAIVREGGLFVQVGGGIRDEARILRYLELGAARVILGTIAVEDFAFLCRMVEKYGEKIAVGVDARDGMVAVKGWRETAPLDSLEFCEKLDQAGVSTIIYTDISRDGAMSGTNLEVYRQLADRVNCDIVASGGISYQQELITLRDMGTYGAILGKALYTGALKLEEVLSLC